MIVWVGRNNCDLNKLIFKWPLAYRERLFSVIYPVSKRLFIPCRYKPALGALIFIARLEIRLEKSDRQIKEGLLFWLTP